MEESGKRGVETHRLGLLPEAWLWEPQTVFPCWPKSRHNGELDVKVANGR